MGTSELNAGGNPAMDSHPIQGEVEILLVASCYRKRDKHRPGGPLGSYVDFTYYCMMVMYTCIYVHVMLAQIVTKDK